MDSNDDLRGAEANTGGAMANQIAVLQLQVAELTQMLQSGVKMEVVSDADKQSVKNALEGLDGGDLFNEAVAVQYSQAKLQQQQTQREVLQLKRQVQDKPEVWVLFKKNSRYLRRTHAYLRRTHVYLRRTHAPIILS